MANEYVAEFLREAFDGVRKNHRRSNSKIIWKPMIKEWDTLYAICINKEYDCDDNITTYTLRDFEGNISTVDAYILKRTILLNKIDVVNLNFWADDQNGYTGITLSEIPIYEANTLNEIAAVLNQHKNGHYAVGNIKSGFFTMKHGAIEDYKGYSEEIWLPECSKIAHSFLSFNDYTKIVHIPSSFKKLNFWAFYAARKLTDIYHDIGGADIVKADGFCYYSNRANIYVGLQDREDVILHTRTFDLDTRKVISMLQHIDDVHVFLKLRGSLDTSDKLQASMLKLMMLGANEYNIDFNTGELVSCNRKMHTNIKELRLPPVKKLRNSWYPFGSHIETLYLPETLETKMLTVDNIPTISRTTYVNDIKNTTWERAVDTVVIPNSIKHFIFVTKQLANLGIRFITPFGNGLANDIKLDMPKLGSEVKVVKQLTRRAYVTTEYNCKRKVPVECVVIQDRNGKKLEFTSDDLLEKMIQGQIQLVNADVFLDRSIKRK